MNPSSLRRIERTNYLLGGVLVAVSPFLMNKEQALGLLVGVVLSAVNFSLLRRIVEKWLGGAAKGNHMSGFFLIPKMSLLMALVFVSLSYLPISAVTFTVGFSIFVISIAIETARSLAGFSAGDVPNGDDANIG